MRYLALTEVLDLHRRTIEQTGGATGWQGEDVFLRRLGVHGDQHFYFPLAGYVALFAGADRVPGWQTGDVRREQIFPADGDSHAEDAFEQYQIGRLRPGTVDGRHLNAEVIDDALWCKCLNSRCATRSGCAHGHVSSRHLAGFPSPME